MSAESPSNISPNPSEVMSEVSELYFQKKPKKDLKIAPRGPGGGPGSNFFLPKFLLFFFRSPCKIWEPYDNPFWKNSDGEEREKEKKSMIIVVPSSDRLTA